MHSLPRSFPMYINNHSRKLPKLSFGSFSFFTNKLSLCSCPPASADIPEMVDNPLYGPVNTGSNPPLGQNRPHKPPEPAPRKNPAVRQRSMTYSTSERKPAVLEKAAVKNVLSAMAPNSVNRPEIVAPKPRPPLPAKSHALREAQNN